MTMTMRAYYYVVTTVATNAQNTDYFEIHTSQQGRGKLRSCGVCTTRTRVHTRVVVCPRGPLPFSFEPSRPPRPAPTPDAPLHLAGVLPRSAPPRWRRQYRAPRNPVSRMRPRPISRMCCFASIGRGPLRTVTAVPDGGGVSLGTGHRETNPDSSGLTAQSSSLGPSAGGCENTLSTHDQVSSVAGS